MLQRAPARRPPAGARTRFGAKAHGILSALLPQSRDRGTPAQEIAGVKLSDIDAVAEKMQGGQLWRDGVGAPEPQFSAGRSRGPPHLRDREGLERHHALRRPVARRQRGRPSAASVATWQTGYPLRVELRQRQARVRFLPLFDRPHAGRERRRSARLALLVHDRPRTADRRASPPSSWARPASGSSQPPAVFIPVGTPGIDHAGLHGALRQRRVPAVEEFGRSRLPSAADVLAAMEQAL